MADGTLKVGTITTSSGSGNITIGSGVTVNVNRPAFEAYLSSNQTLSDATTTKVQYNTEVFDTNSCYDNSTNYRFTPTEAGKYFVYIANSVSADDVSRTIQVYNYIYKNGSSYKFAVHDASNNNGLVFDPFLSAVVDMNGTTDYLEGFTNINVSSGTPSAQGSANKRTYFGAYKLGA